MPGLYDWTINPLGVLQEMFDDCSGSGDWREKTSEFFSKEVKKPMVLSKIPWLNETPLHCLKPNQVVHFRGMIQDMLDTEFYLDVYEVYNSKTGVASQKPGRYRDVAECGPDEEIRTDSILCKTGDRLNYYVIPIPGENMWVKELYEETNPPVTESRCSGHRSKRCLDAGEVERVCENIHQSTSEDSGAGAGCLAANGVETKRIKGEEESLRSYSATDKLSSTSELYTVGLNFPLHEMTGVACQVKFYSSVTFSLNDVIDVVGVLSVDPSLGHCGSSTQEGSSEYLGCMMDADEAAAHSQPASLVPRLHVLTAQKMNHCNPLLPNIIDDKCEALREFEVNAREVREVLRKVLQEALLGDKLAPDFLICHLISSVYARQNVMAMGKYCLNLTGISAELQRSEYPKLLYSLLQKLTTQSYFLHMTLDNMNRLKFVPQKDYTKNRLVSGLLQLPSHTHLVIDETSMTPGQLDSCGVGNVTALGNLISWQKVDYDFKFHQLEQQTDIPVLILSEGNSMIRSDVQVKLQPDHTDVAAAFSKVDEMLTQDLLQKFRCYLTVARVASYNLEEGMQKLIQDDFVASRQNNSGMTADDLHNLLNLTRLLSLTCGEGSATPELWRSAKILESERRNRLPSERSRQY